VSAHTKFTAKFGRDQLLACCSARTLVVRKLFWAILSCIQISLFRDHDGKCYCWVGKS